MTEIVEPARIRAQNIAKRFFRHENAVLVMILVVIIATMAGLTKGEVMPMVKM